jgi:hypothetical protein
VKRDDVLVRLGDLLEHGDLVADHVLAALHELLVDDFACVVLVRPNVHGLLHDRVRATPEGLARPVLRNGRQARIAQ